MASAALGQVYLIPTFLDEEHLETIPVYITDAVKECQAFFVENERTSRRYLKRLWKEMVVENYEWHVVHKVEEDVKEKFKKLLQRGMTIAILSEAGCPGIADPGQILVSVAQLMGVKVKPFTGPSSIFLALMASGMNGQNFHFHGYLPIDQQARTRSIKDLETESSRKKITEIFIETPYRNNQLLQTILNHCSGSTQLCLAVDLTAATEFIQTKTISEWRKNIPDIHKRPAIFLLYAGS